MKTKKYDIWWDTERLLHIYDSAQAQVEAAGDRVTVRANKLTFIQSVITDLGVEDLVTEECWK